MKNWDKRAGTKELGQESWDKKTGTKRLGQRRWDKEAGTKELGQGSWDKGAGTKKLGRRDIWELGWGASRYDAPFLNALVAAALVSVGGILLVPGP